MRVRLADGIWIEVEIRYPNKHDMEGSLYMAFYRSETSERETRIPPNVSVFMCTYFNGEQEVKSESGKGIFMYNRINYHVCLNGKKKIEFKHAFITLVDGEVVHF